jgi:hypothetical protein
MRVERGMRDAAFEKWLLTIGRLDAAQRVIVGGAV